MFLLQINNYFGEQMEPSLTFSGVGLVHTFGFGLGFGLHLGLGRGFLGSLVLVCGPLFLVLGFRLGLSLRPLPDVNRYTITSQAQE